eukprot:7816405-Alexandrium_andersonii.AAC.1
MGVLGLRKGQHTVEVALEGLILLPRDPSHGGLARGVALERDAPQEDAVPARVLQDGLEACN